MTPRSIRRAAERRALKEARKAAAPATQPVTALVTPTISAITEPLSERRLAANRANAQLSTGPTSPDGKAKVSLNAVKTGLTGQTVLLPSDDVAAYETLVAGFVEQYQPATPQERQLVQSLADTRWRLNRIPALEFALFARGHHEFAEKFANVEPSLANAMIDAETLVVYARQLKNLHTQEGRLRRHYQQDVVALTALQAERRAAQAEAEAAAAAATATAHETKTAAQPSDRTRPNGFEFTTDKRQPGKNPATAPVPQFSIATRAA